MGKKNQPPAAANCKASFCWEKMPKIMRSDRLTSLDDYKCITFCHFLILLYSFWLALIDNRYQE
jgi:hypothetical protein